MVRAERFGAPKKVAKEVDMVKRKYRFRVSGHFMGTYRNKYDVIELYPKQAKYGLLSGQLEMVETIPPIVAKSAVEPTVDVVEAAKPRRRRFTSSEGGA